MYDKLPDWIHGWPHIKRVGRNARELAELVGADPIICGISAYCHDLGRIIEELSGIKKVELGNTDHSLDSIQPTVTILNQVGINGQNFNSIVGAIVLHSDKLYYGKNLVAKVLRDSDKKDAFGPWGNLRHANYCFGRDLVETQKILESQDSPEVIMALADETLELIKRNGKMKEHYLKILNFVLEWVENKMIDTEQGYSFVQEEYEYTKKSREFLLK